MNDIKVIAVTAAWCGPCKRLKPKLQALADAGHIDLSVIDASVKEQAHQAAELNVRNVPTVVMTLNGKEVARFAGDQSEANLVNIFQRAGAWKYAE